VIPVFLKSLRHTMTAATRVISVLTTADIFGMRVRAMCVPATVSMTALSVLCTCMVSGILSIASKALSNLNKKDHPTGGLFYLTVCVNKSVEHSRNFNACCIIQRIESARGSAFDHSASYSPLHSGYCIL